MESRLFQAWPTSPLTLSPEIWRYFIRIFGDTPGENSQPESTESSAGQGREVEGAGARPGIPGMDRRQFKRTHGKSLRMIRWTEPDSKRSPTGQPQQKMKRQGNYDEKYRH
jgi:hypothetical protein